LTDELIRAAVAVPIALLLPLVGRQVPGRPARAAFASTVVLAALAPHFDDWETWTLVAATALAASVPPEPSFDRPLLPLGLVIGVVAVAVGLTDPSAAWDAVEDVARSRDVVLVLGGGLAARFPSFAEEKFAEYYLIGTLLSLLIAAATAVGVRAAMGLDPLG
jgi:hypothetical protein